MRGTKQLIINCGASQVTAAEFSRVERNLRIDKLVSERLSYDVSDDDAWLSAVAAALLRLAQQHKITGRATLIIPGNQVLTKTIRIPHVEASKRKQMIAFEAQQKIPYPMYEIVWDSQEVSDDGVETELLFIACKSAVIDSFSRSVAGSGIQIESISAATVLDYNALRFAAPAADQDVLMVNVGARSTNLLFKSANGFFVRNINLGGNLLTQSIADRLGQSFEQAESIKLKYFSGAADFTSEDAGDKQLIECAESFTRRMTQEITRSIVNYRRQTRESAPAQILLTGRGALLNGLSAAIAGTQKVAVEFFDPLLSVQLSASIEPQGEQLSLEVSEIIGEACRELIPSAAGANLLPVAEQQAIAFSAKKPFLLIAAACLALAPWPLYLAFNSASADLVASNQAMLMELDPLLAHQSFIEMNSLRASQLADAIQKVEGLVSSKTNWIQFLKQLQAGLSLTEDVWLDQLQVLRASGLDVDLTYEVVLSGKMLVRDSVGNQRVDQQTLSTRIKRLQSSFEGSDFVVTSKPPVITWTSLRAGLNVLPFRINLVVDTAKPL